MLYKSLILGVLFSIGIFAVKSGVGIAYVAGKKNRRKTIFLIVLLYILVYGLVFSVAALIVPRIDPAGHLAAIQAFLQSGMIVHLVLSAVMLAWGLLLLKHSGLTAAIPSSASRAWLVLALPCPVCITVILLSSAFLVACFPDHPLRVVLLLYLIFMSVGLIMLGLSFRFQQLATVSSEVFLGTVMLLVAAYFLVSVAVMPQFADLDKVYRLAAHPDDTHLTDPSQLAMLAGCIMAAFGSGCVLTFNKIRNAK